MFKKPTDKVKLKEGQVKLTTEADQNLPAPEPTASAAETPAERPVVGANSITEPQKKAPDKSGKFKIILEKPSRAGISLFVTLAIGAASFWTLTNGPLAPTTAQMLFNNGKFEAVIIIVNGLVKRDGDQTKLLLLRAQALEHKGIYNRALDDTKILITRNDMTDAEKALAYATHAEVLMDLKRDAEAVEFIKKAAQLDPTLSTVMHRRAFYHLTESRLPLEAIKLETIALTMDPKLPKSLLNRSTAYRKAGQYQKAIDDCNRALALDIDWKSLPPELSNLRQQFHTNLSDAYFGLDDFPNAIKNAMIACTMSEDAAKNTDLEPDPGPFRSLAKAYLADKKPAEALKMIEKISSKIDRDGVLLALQREALIALGRQNEADKTGASSKSEKDEAYAEFYEDTFDFYNAKDYKHVINSATQTLNIRPNEVWVLRMRAEAYRFLHEYENVITDASAVINLARGGMHLFGEMYFIRGEAFEKLGQLDKAKTDYESAKEHRYTKEKDREYFPTLAR